MRRIAIRMRINPPKRRSPMQRLKSRLYYRRNKAKIRVQRRRYMRTHKTILKRRKLFHRYRPSWLKRPKPRHITPKAPKKFKIFAPKMVKHR